LRRRRCVVCWGLGSVAVKSIGTSSVTSRSGECGAAPRWCSCSNDWVAHPRRAQEIDLGACSQAIGLFFAAVQQTSVVNAGDPRSARTRASWRDGCSVSG
jgi:hypothetical protein